MPNSEKQAFPSSGQGYAYAGMTLRDWFDGQALACLADPAVAGGAEDIAGYCYEVADAMMAEREE